MQTNKKDKVILKWSPDSDKLEATSRFLLDNTTLARISQELPDLRNLQEAVLPLGKDIISLAFISAPASTIPIAAVCLQDATDTIVEAQYALNEFFAHKIWYQEKSNPPQEVIAVFFSRFYAAAVASRLYSAGEHLSNAIISMLEITDDQLENYKTSSRTSRQAIVGNFLANERPNHPITQVVSDLAESEEWQTTIYKYRNKWVHKQPPTIEGMGIVYNRHKRWKRLGTSGRYVLEGGGDEPKYSVDDILDFIQAALFLFVDVLTAIVQFYIKLLENYGIDLVESTHKQTKSSTQNQGQETGQKHVATRISVQLELDSNHNSQSCE
ncbi:MAG: hypothetical protein GY832_29745 [Chloroflexi bacterium]|nr:hypothetical protein [Chloroflexota bacterium]